jgi:hypothetical protein
MMCRRIGECLVRDTARDWARKDTTLTEYKPESGGLVHAKIRVTIRIIYVSQNFNRQPR